MKKDDLLTKIKEQRLLQYDINPPIPKKNFLIEVTNACNSSCIFCANRKMTRKKGMIDKQLLERILKEANELGTEEVGFYTTGEPFVNTCLEEYIGMAKKIGYKYVYLTTNGALADIDRIKKSVCNGLNSIKFSINAINKEMYQFVHGHDDFDKVMKNLQDTYSYREEQQLQFKIYVSYIATRYSYAPKELINSIFGKYSDEVIIMNAINQSGLTPEVKSLLRVEEKNIINYTIELPCNMPFNSLYVSWEGYLTACCADFQNYLAYADLNRTTIKEAWNNETIRKIRERHLNKDVKKLLCQNCVYNTLEKPSPLKMELATEFHEELLFEYESAEKRIKEYIEVGFFTG